MVNDCTIAVRNRCHAKTFDSITKTFDFVVLVPALSISKKSYSKRSIANCLANFCRPPTIEYIICIVFTAKAHYVFLFNISRPFLLDNIPQFVKIFVRNSQKLILTPYIVFSSVSINTWWPSIF